MVAKSSPAVAPSILRRSRGSSKARNQSFDEQNADLYGTDSRCEPAMVDHRNQSVDEENADLYGTDSICEPAIVEHRNQSIDEENADLYGIKSSCEPAVVDHSCCTPNKTPPDRLSFSPSEVYLYLEGTFLSLYIMHVYFIGRSMLVGILKVISVF